MGWMILVVVYNVPRYLDFRVFPNVVSGVLVPGVVREVAACYGQSHPMLRFEHDTNRSQIYSEVIYLSRRHQLGFFTFCTKLI